MQAVDLIDEPYVDPDELKMPESPQHRRVVDLIACVAQRLMPKQSVYCDMNWYPRDGGKAVAPDVMTLPNGALPDHAKSYKQPPGGPLPGVVVEVPSESDVVSAFHAKTHRYNRLGVVVYTVIIEDNLDVLRLAGGNVEAWRGRPIPELGGLSIDVEGTGIVVRMPNDETPLQSTNDLIALFVNRANAATARLAMLGVDTDEHR